MITLALFLVVTAPRTFEEVDYSFAAEEGDVVVDGVKIHVLRSGPRDGEKVLLLHCFGLSSQVWREVMPALAEAGFDVVAYDAPGHGKSDKPTRKLKLAHLGEVAVGVLDAVGFARAHLIGSSMGGGTALTVAIEQPERVQRLVLVDAAGLDLRTPLSVAWRGLNPRHAQGGADWMWGFVYDLAVEKQSPLVERVRAELLSTRADPQSARAVISFVSIVDDLFVTDRTPDLPRVHARTLVVTGAHDRLVHPDVSRAMAAGIAGATLVVYDDVGHLPQLEDSARLVDDLVPFLQQPEPAPDQVAITRPQPKNETNAAAR